MQVIGPIEKQQKSEWRAARERLDSARAKIQERRSQEPPRRTIAEITAEIKTLNARIEELRKERLDANKGLPLLEDIQDMVCAYYGTTQTELCSGRKTGDIIRPRHVAFFLCKKLTLHSLPRIGRAFGDKDHTTVLSAVRKIEAMQRINVGLAKELEDLERLLLVASPTTEDAPCNSPQTAAI